MEGEAATGPRFKGQSVELGGTTYIVPPLALGQVKELLPRIQSLKSIDGVPGPDDLETMVDTALAAFQRNYPEMTSLELLTLLDLGNIGPVFRMIMGRSGFEAVAGNGVPGTATP